MNEEKKKFNAKGFAILLILCVIAMMIAIYFLLSEVFQKNVEQNQVAEKPATTEEKEPVGGETKEVVTENEYAVKDNNLSKFDLSFLKFENEEKNKIYSPLSIKYAFKMLEEATEGEAHDQIASIIEAYHLTEYESNDNMALANAFFIRDTYKDSIKANYINAIVAKYNADVQFDDFSTADKINQWIENHTLKLIPNLLSDSDVSELQFALINALGIDMEWNHKFLKYSYDDDENITMSTTYNHARLPNSEWEFSWYVDEMLYNIIFDNTQHVSSMKVYASLNNYDPVEELGEEAIRAEVYDDFRNWALGEGKYANEYNGQNDSIFNGDFSEKNIQEKFDAWFDKGINVWNEGGENEGYIAKLNENKDKVDYSTDFSIYVDENVKVFAKDLKEYNGTTLEYIGIMPIKEDLAQYIEDNSNEDILETIGKLKELKLENFKDGYLTYIHGYIPKFDFEYDLDLQNDLEKLGVTDVFEEGKANLTKMTDDTSVFIGKIKHKANIEFTQDGIKAAAATMLGGMGAGDWYDYFLEMPTEEIDITFDKPYMFLIRDKETKETWFVGTVYEPLDAEEETNEILVPIEYRNEAE